MTIRHFSEADLLETYYMQPGESMPVMMHLASCTECAARYERLERKLREAATCNTERPATFWARQRVSITRKVTAARDRARGPRSWRVAAAAILAFFLGGAVVYESVEPKLRAVSAPPAVAATNRPEAQPATASQHFDPASDAWQSDELDDFHAVVQWESWVAETKGAQGRTSL